MAAFDFGSKLDPVTIEALLAKDYDVEMQAALRRGWEMFREHVGEFTGFTLIVFLVSSLSSGLAGAGSVVALAVIAPLSAGYLIAAFRILAGREFRFNDLFSGFGFFLPLMLAGLASGLIVSAGTVLLIVPGIYFLVSYIFAGAFVIDYGMEFWQAMESSRRIVARHWFRLFGFVLLLSLVNLLGALALGIGLLVTIPVTSCAAAVIYRGIVGEHDGTW